VKKAESRKGTKIKEERLETKKDKKMDMKVIVGNNRIESLFERVLERDEMILRKEIQEQIREEKGNFPEAGDDRGDIARKNLEAELYFFQLERRFEKLKGMRRVLEKVKEGSYGVCDQCHKLIEAERLKISPSAVLCIFCAKNSR